MSASVRTRVRDHVPAVTALLSVVSLSLVFAAAGQRIPPSVLPAAPASVLEAIPHVNAVLSVVAIVTISLGVHAIREGNVARHRKLMATSFGLFALFLVLYLWRVALLGPQEFPGPSAVEQFLYFPVLAIHILLAIVCVPLLYYVLLLAATHPTHELRDTRHPTVGTVAAGLWLVSFFLGIVVYALLYVIY